MNIYNESKLLQFRVRLESMLAENKHRELSGNSLAYTEENFDSLDKEIEDFIDKNQNKNEDLYLDSIESYIDNIQAVVDGCCAGEVVLSINKNIDKIKEIIKKQKEE